jgi:hypothetical protein
MVNPGGGRAVLQECQQFVNGGPVALGGNFDRAVAPVSHPAHKPDARRLALGVMAEIHALDHSGDNNVYTCSFLARIVAHARDYTRVQLQNYQRTGTGFTRL